MNKKKNLIVLIVMEIIILLFPFILFIVPLIKINIDFSKIYTKEEKAITDTIIDSIQKNKIPELEDKFIPVKDLNKSLSMLNTYFNDNKIEHIKLVNCNFNSFHSVNKKIRAVQFQYSVKFSESKFGLLLIELYTENKMIKIHMLRIIQLEKSIEELNSFYGDKIDIVRVFIIALSIMLMVFLAYSEFDYYKTSKEPKIWLQIVMPVSFFTISINWNSLETAFKAASVNFMPISSFRSGLAGVWEYHISIPVFLLVYWLILRKKNLKDTRTFTDAPL